MRARELSRSAGRPAAIYEFCPVGRLEAERLQLIRWNHMPGKSKQQFGGIIGCLQSTGLDPIRDVLLECARNLDARQTVRMKRKAMQIRRFVLEREGKLDHVHTGSQTA